MAEKQKRDFEPLPYYRWYWRTFRSDRRVQRMHYVARGLLRELLDEQWEKGFVPDDPAACADICGCPPSVMKTHWNTLEQMFESVAQGVMRNPRLERERTDSDQGRVTKSLAGVKSGESRRRKRADANKDEHPLTDTNALLSSSSSSNEQSKSSLESSAESSDARPPIAALARQGARGVGARNGLSRLEESDWRGAFREAGVAEPSRSAIGFGREDPAE